MVEFACTRRPVLGTPALAGEAPWRKTQQAQEVQSSFSHPGFAPVCAGLRFEAGFYDLLTEADVCTRLSALVESSTGWRPGM